MSEAENNKQTNKNNRNIPGYQHQVTEVQGQLF